MNKNLRAKNLSKRGKVSSLKTCLSETKNTNLLIQLIHDWTNKKIKAQNLSKASKCFKSQNYSRQTRSLSLLIKLAINKGTKNISSTINRWGKNIIVQNLFKASECFKSKNLLGWDKEPKLVNKARSWLSM